MSIQQLNHYNREIKLPNGERWNCEQCSSFEVRKTMLSSENQNKRKKIDEDQNETSENAEKQWSINDVMSKLLEMDRKYTDLMTKYQQQVDVNNELRTEISDLKKKLNNQINKSEQKELKNNLIVKGMPQTEDDAEVIKKLGSKLQVRVGNVKIFRLGKKDSNATPIKVCFESESEKITFMRAQKNKRLSTTDLGFNQSNNIYLDHDLTKKNMELYKAARIFRKEHNYKFIWIRDGKVFLRRTENSRAILIEDTDDLKN